ncbi:MAG: sulfurtransferase TusA family protein [Burkholderiaceae bacterium]|nr:sulfurtransferase TusA family protein [Burkholderiaceae bacterium]MCX8004427.1 sulfurtransferase TusA family protein [Burkholderiaceae bacterium]
MGLFGTRPRAQAAEGGGQVRLADGRLLTVARQVDCRGDSCPRPQLMTKRALSEVAPGAVIDVLVDNPTSMEALPPLADELGAAYLETVKDGAFWHVLIRRN